MAYSSSAAKRNRQNEKRRSRNRMYRSRVKTLKRRFLASVEAKSREEAERNYRELESLLDRGTSKGVLQRNAVSRMKSRLHNLLNKSDLLNKSE